MKNVAVAIHNADVHLYVPKQREVIVIEPQVKVQDKPKRDWFGASTLAVVFILGVVLYSL